MMVTTYLRHVVLLSLFATPASVTPSANAQQPPKIHIDRGACPFECCTYREWVAKKDKTLVNAPNGKKVVAHIHKGERVQAITGEVHSHPLRVVARHDHLEAGVKVGDTIYILHYMGEGYWKVWHNGKLIDIENFSDEGPYPKYTWWVKLKTHAGAIGWTLNERSQSGNDFDNTDACGG